MVTPVFKIEVEYVGRRVMVMEVPRKRMRGKPKRRWLDNTKNDFKSKKSCQGGGGENARHRSRIKRRKGS